MNSCTNSNIKISSSNSSNNNSKQQQQAAQEVMTGGLHGQTQTDRQNRFQQHFTRELGSL